MGGLGTGLLGVREAPPLAGLSLQSEYARVLQVSRHKAGRILPAKLRAKRASTRKGFLTKLKALSGSLAEMILLAL